MKIYRLYYLEQEYIPSDYIDEDGKLVEYVEVTMVDKIIDVPMSLKEVNIGLLVNRIIELGLYK